MTKLRKITGILPLIVMGLLFSIVVSVFSQDFTGYIGQMSCVFDTTLNKEELKLELYSDSQLTTFIKEVQILTEGASTYGLVAAASSAQAQRTQVVVTANNIGGGVFKVSTIRQIDQPGDIASMFDGFKLSAIYNSLSGLCGKLDTQYIKANEIYGQNFDFITNQLYNLSVAVNDLDVPITDFDNVLEWIYYDLDRNIMVVSAHTAPLGTLSTSLGNIDTLNLGLYNIPIYNTVYNFNSNFRGKIVTIETKLTNEGTKLQAIWDAVRP